MARWRKSVRGVRLRRFILPAAFLIALGVTGTGIFARNRPQAAPSPAQVSTTPPNGGYVGVAECAGCHENETKGYRASLHSQASNSRTPAAANGCETCHGPGAWHVEDPGAKGRIKVFTKMAPREVGAVCQTCHNRQEHEQWQGSMHDARNVSCINCHSVMTPKSEAMLLKQPTITATCAQCHRDKAAKLQRSSHMPVREGKLECTTCHNQHGSTNASMLRVGNSVNEFCASCHAEKRGPFLWEHAPVRENCASCHDPHGSSNERLLVAKAPTLCQRCHAPSQHPSTIYDSNQLTAKSNKLVNRACVNCHSQIHGSNHPAGKRFQR